MLIESAHIESRHTPLDFISPFLFFLLLTLSLCFARLIKKEAVICMWFANAWKSKNGLENVKKWSHAMRFHRLKHAQSIEATNSFNEIKNLHSIDFAVFRQCSLCLCVRVNCACMWLWQNLRVQSQMSAYNQFILVTLFYRFASFLSFSIIFCSVNTFPSSFSLSVVYQTNGL